MAIRNSIRAGKAEFEISANTKPIQAKLADLSKRLQSIGKGLQSVGKIGITAAAGITASLTGTVAAIGKFSTNFTKSADIVAKASRRLEVPVEALSEIVNEAELAGISIEEIETSLNRLSRSIHDPEFLSLKTQLNGVTKLSEKFKILDKYLNSIEDRDLKIKTTTRLLGLSGVSLLPNLGALSNSTRRGFTSRQTEVAEQWNDSLTKLRQSLDGLSARLGERVLPLMTDLLERFDKYIQNITDPELDHMLRKGVEYLAKIAGYTAGLAVLSASIYSLGTIISGFGSVVGVASRFKMGGKLGGGLGTAAATARAAVDIPIPDKLKGFFQKSLPGELTKKFGQYASEWAKKYFYTVTILETGVNNSVDLLKESFNLILDTFETFEQGMSRIAGSVSSGIGLAFDFSRTGDVEKARKAIELTIKIVTLQLQEMIHSIINPFAFAIKGITAMFNGFFSTILKVLGGAGIFVLQMISDISFSLIDILVTILKYIPAVGRSSDQLGADMEALNDNIKAMIQSLNARLSADISATETNQAIDDTVNSNTKQLLNLQKELKALQNSLHKNVEAVQEQTEKVEDYSDQFSGPLKSQNTHDLAPWSHEFPSKRDGLDLQDDYRYKIKELEHIISLKNQELVGEITAEINRDPILEPRKGSGVKYFRGSKTALDDYINKGRNMSIGIDTLLTSFFSKVQEQAAWNNFPKPSKPVSPIDIVSSTVGTFNAYSATQLDTNKSSLMVQKNQLEVLKQMKKEFIEEMKETRKAFKESYNNIVIQN